MDEDETWHAGRRRLWPHCVRCGPSSPSRQRGTATQFLAHIFCGQMARRIKMPFSRELGLGPSDTTLDGDPAPPPPKGDRAPKMVLGMEVGLGPSHIVLHRDSAPIPKKWAEPLPIFGPCLLWPYDWMDQDDTWHGGGPLSRPRCFRWGPIFPSPKSGQTPNFWPISVVAKRLDASRCHFVWR